jgi:hypothetical protein
MRFLLLLLLAVHAFGADAVPIDLAGSYRSSTDERVIAEVRFTLEADTLPEKQEGTLYFVPIGLATEEEKNRNRAFAQYAIIKSQKPFTSWGYSLGIWPRPNSFEIEVSTERQEGKAVRIEREASFHVDRFADVRIEKAGIRLTLTWKKKPNQPPEPMPVKRHGSS